MEMPGSVSLTFDAAASSMDALQRAAYRFADRFSCELIAGEDEHRCVLSPVADEVDVEAEVAAFRTEVLDQVLRQRIRAETEPLRTMILAHAFSKTGLADPPEPS